MTSFLRVGFLIICISASISLATPLKIRRVRSASNYYFPQFGYVQPYNPMYNYPYYPGLDTGYHYQPQFPNPPLPYYPSYPYPSGHGDPFANIPTQIIDVDDPNEDAIIPEGAQLFWSQTYPWNQFEIQPIISEISPDKIKVTASNSGSSYGVSDNSFTPVSNSIVENKPIQATISRVFSPNSDQPVVDVRYSPNTEDDSEEDRENNATDEDDDEKTNLNLQPKADGEVKEDKKVSSWW